MKTNNLTESENLTLAYELKNTVSNWVNTFNFIQLAVLEKYTDDLLFDKVEYNLPTIEDIAEFTGKSVEQINIECDGDIEVHESYNDTADSINQDNYPMWNTCFEFKESISDDIKQAARNAGFGIIDGLDDFNTILFVSGCGYSFYGAHWIPLFLELPWNTDLKEKYKNVNYSMM